MKKLWTEIFLKMSIIFVVFIFIIFLSNSVFLYSFFEGRQQQLLVEQMERIAALDLNNKTETAEALRNIRDKYNFEVEIYYINGNTIYTTLNSQIMDYHYSASNNFFMKHKPLEVISEKNRSNGVMFTGVERLTGNEFLVFKKLISNDIYAEIQIQKGLLRTSAQTASEFVMYVSAACLLMALLWVLWFAKKITKPISVMNEITRDMANLQFERRVPDYGNNEIGSLGSSVNDMSQKLSKTLNDLRQTNAKLTEEIELERRLDAMRKGFVANVSHELKTPISIIKGYAEGLKLNINESKKEQYCDILINESDRMNELVLSILELSKYESAQVPVNKTSFDIVPVLKDRTELIFKNFKGEIVFCVPNSLFVLADKMLIEQVIKSYLENALSHINSLGTLKITAELCENKAKISVTNTGSTISAEQMPLIWQSFYRGDNSHKRDKNRFGLGLSIVSAICKMHNTECGVKSEQNSVTFWFTADTE